MDDNKKLFDGLLKADGIDPAGATESERAAFGEMLDEQSESNGSKPGLRPEIWRIIMTSKMTKFAVAAVIIIAVLVGMNQFGGSIDGTSIALADVAERIEQVKNAVFKQTTIVSSKDNITKTFESLVYYTEDAVRGDVYENKKITGQIYVRSLEGIHVAIDHKRRVYKKTDLTDADMKKVSPAGPPISPKNIVDLILSKGKYKKLGQKTVDGVLAEGFEFNDRRTILSTAKANDITVRLWVDVNTLLPIRAEVDATLIDNSKANTVMYDPKWDVELEPEFFEIRIPDNYITPEQRGLIGVGLENWPALKVAPDMPAEKAGVKDGDIVIKVNGDGISHIKSKEDALILLFGKAGETIALTVKRDKQILTFEIERESLPE